MSNLTQSSPRSAAAFGTNPASHMYLAHYKNGKWRKGKIQAFEEISLSPLAMCFHYGQTVFEGLKAFRSPKDDILIFRHRDNYRRMNRSLERMGMPALPETIWDEGVEDLVARVKDEVPGFQQGSLYIRPFVVASQAKLGVDISEEYLFMVVVCPASSYYSKNLKVKVERNFSRAAPGGVGFAKCGGNYGASLFPFRQARAEGFDQILWTDSVHHEWLEESGTMNFGFIIDGLFITPPVSDTILDGITRRSVLQLARAFDIPVEERPFSVAGLKEAFEAGKRVEAFGIGTAAVLAPFESIDIDGTEYFCYIGHDAAMHRLKSCLLDIQTGQREDEFNWNTLIE